MGFAVYVESGMEADSRYVQQYRGTVVDLGIHLSSEASSVIAVTTTCVSAPGRFHTAGAFTLCAQAKRPCSPSAVPHICGHNPQAMQAKTSGE
jgi:hypothetical protein